MQRIRILTLLLFISFQSIGQFNLESSFIYGGNSVDEPKDIAVSASEAFLYFGSRSFSNDGDVPGNAGASDFWIMKQTIDGTLLWSKNFGAIGNDDLEAIMPHSDGGVLAFGTTHTDQGIFGDITGLAGGWLMRTNTNGTIIDGKIFGGNITETAVDAFRHTSGNVTMAMEAGSNVLNGQNNNGLIDSWIVHVNSSFDIQWTSLLGGSGVDVPEAITSDINGNIYVAATSNSNLPDLNNNQGGTDVWIYKLGPDGSLLWQKTFGGSEDDKATDILIHPNGSVYVIAQSESADGNFYSNHGLNDLWMIQLDATSGSSFGLQPYGGSGNDYNGHLDVYGNDHLVVTASTTSGDLDLTGNKGFGDVWIFTTDLNRNLTSQMNYGGSLNDFAVDIVTVDSVFHVLSSSLSIDKNVPPNSTSQLDLWYYTLNTRPDSCSVNYVCLQDSTTSNQLYPPAEDVLVCVNGCTAGYGPGPNFNTNSCFDFTLPTAYFFVTTDTAADLLTLSVTSNDFNQPQLALFRTVNCNTFQQIECTSGFDGSALLSYIDISPLTTYIIAISDLEGNIGEFELCASSIDVEFCNKDDVIYVTSTSLGSPPTGPYKPGEEVQFCYELRDWDKLDCNGFQGLLPTFGPGWDSTWFAPSGEPIQVDSMLIPEEEGFWAWYPLGEVHYNISNPVNGYHGGQGMPAGWYFTNTADPPPATEPDQTTGDINNCLPTQDNWKVCFTLKVVDECESNIDCSVTMKTFADGELGINPSLACVYDQEETFTANLQCCLNPTIQAIHDFTTCNGDTIAFKPETNLIPPVTYTWVANPDPFIEGASSQSDATRFYQILGTTAAIPLKVRYSIFAEGNGCQTESENFEVTVLPQPTSRISITGPNIVCSGSTVTFNFESTGTPPFIIGLYRENEFFANILSESPLLSIDIDPVFSGRFRIGEFRDANCQGLGLGFVNVTVKPVSTTIIDTSICEQDSFVVGSEVFTEAGSYNVVLENASENNCDSIVQLTLSITPTITETIDEVICTGDTLFVLDEPYTESTDEIIEYFGPTGCPNYIHLILEVQDTFSTEISQTICFGDTLNFEGVLVYEPGTYSHLVEIQPGCFEETVLHLSVLPAILINDLAIIADNGNNTGAILVEIVGGTPPFTYLWNTSQTTESLFNVMFGTYTLTVTDQLGCMEVFTFEVPKTTAVNEAANGIDRLQIWPTITSPGELLQLLNLGATSVDIASVDWWTMGGQSINAMKKTSCDAGIALHVPVPGNLASGAYYLRILSGEGKTVWFKVIIQ